MPGQIACDHSRGLCGQPDIPDNSPRSVRAVVEANPAHCLCCGSEMSISECTGLDMQLLGMYWLFCPTCPPRKTP